MDLLRIAARIATTFVQGSAKEEVTKAYESDPALLKEMLRRSGPSITWLAKRLREGEDPLEVSKAAKALSQAVNLLPSEKKVLTGYKDLADLQATLSALEGEEGDDPTDEEIVQAMAPYKVAFKKAYAWEPKTDSSGWELQPVLDAVVDGRKPIGEVRAGVTGEKAKRGGTPAFHAHIEELGLQTFPVANASNRAFVFKPENEDVARMVAALYMNPFAVVTGKAAEFVIGVGYGFPLESTLKWAGYDEMPAWVETLLK